MNNNKRICLAFGMGLMALASHATEGGGSTYAAGADVFLQGAVPPPGFYVLQYGNVYHADRLNDAAGNTRPIPDFKVRVAATATRFVWSTPYQFGGGNLVMHTIVPLVDLKVSAGGASQHRTGLGDITFGPGLAHHYSENVHDVIAFDLVAPTGKYDRNNLANVGRNYWSLQPLYTMSYIDKTGFNGDFKATWNINRRNSSTGYRSGQEFILDYAIGYAVTKDWVVGASGYLYTQLKADTLNGADVQNAKGRGAAIGPALKYDNGKGWIFTAKLQKEFSERNRTQGSALVIKTSIPF